MKNDKCVLMPAPGRYVQSPCSNLAAVATGQHGRSGKGVLSADIVDLYIGQRLGTRYVIASGQHVKPPALMYHCPFCGEPLVRLSESA